MNPNNPYGCTSVGAIALLDWLKEKNLTVRKLEKLLRRYDGSIKHFISSPRNAKPLPEAIRLEIQDVTGIPADDWLVFTEFMPKPKPRKPKPVKSPPFVPWKLEVTQRLARIESALAALATLKEST